MKHPILTKIAGSQGTDEAIIIIKGYLSDGTDAEEVSDDYCMKLRRAHWRGSIYHLWWDASNMKGLSHKMTSGALMALPLMHTIPIVALAGLGSRVHWAKVKNRAKRTGRDLGLNLIRSQVTENKISLLGHSLGVRVTYFLLEAAARHHFRFENVFQLGGAIRRDSSKDWRGITNSINGHIVNVHNKNDKILSSFFKMAEFNQNPCGRKPIKASHSKIHNIDAQRIIGSTSHGAYRKHLAQTISPYFHR